MAPPLALLDALAADDPLAQLRSLDASGELVVMLPELNAGRGFVQPELHAYTVLEHNLAAVAASVDATATGWRATYLRETLSWRDLDGTLQRQVSGLPVWLLLRLAALVHDIAKPHTATRDEDGRQRFPRHGPRGAEMLQQRLPWLGFDEAVTGFIARLVRYHLRPRELVLSWPPTDRAVRRFSRDLGGDVLPLMLLQLADGMATRGPHYTREHFERHCHFLAYVVARADETAQGEPPPLLTGYDLMRELHLSGGRLLGAVLTSIRRAQLEGTISNREEALALARATLRAQSGSGG